MGTQLEDRPCISAHLGPRSEGHLQALSTLPCDKGEMSPTKLPPQNPFELRAELKRLDDEEIVIGSMVTVTWSVPDNYGGGTRSHTGPLAYLDRKRGHYEIKPSNKSPGHYRGYLLGKSSTLRKATDQEAKAPPPAKVNNPFIEREKEKKRPPKKRPVGKVPNPFLKR
jgi:hypothetical protein